MDGIRPAAAPPPMTPLSEETMHKGRRIELGSYSVGNVSWSPRAVVSVKNADGAWQRTPLYATSSAKFPTRQEADRRALDVAKAWIDAEVERRGPEAGDR
jgi:hypothetical protein